MKAVIYARFSTDQQRDASIDDQITLCTEFAERNRHYVHETYFDAGISGASIIQRPDILRLMADARQNRFDVLIVEAIDRLSRNQRDIADIYQNMTFAGIPILSASEGEINELHIGLKGTMNAIFLKDLAVKTRRGQRGRVDAVRIPGGLSYGYDMVAGEERGRRVINPKQAIIIRRIFDEYASGYSPRKIATSLNNEGIPSPRGGQWQASTINGNIKRGNGILPNRLYIGEIVYNRQTFMKDPRTGKRVGRANPKNEWVIKSAPELRIIEQEVWNKVSTRKGMNSRPENYRRSKYLLSGLIRCEECGGPFVVYGRNHMKCGRRRERGTCNNNTTVLIDNAESRVLSALKKHLMTPKLIRVFVEEYKLEWETLAQGRVSKHQAIARDLEKNDTAINALVSAIESGLISPSLIDKLKESEATGRILQKRLTDMPEYPDIPLPSNIAERWRVALSDIQGYLKQENIEAAAANLKKLIKSITVKKQSLGYDLEIAGYLSNNVGCGGRI